MANQVFGFEEIIDWDYARNRGKLQVKAESLPALQALMKETAGTMDRAAHAAMGAALLPPIRTLSRYKAWTQEFLAPQSFELGEDNRIALDNPIGSAYLSSPGGRVEYVTPGVQKYTRPSFQEIDGGIFIHWSTLQYAKWNVLQRRLEETADAMAHKRDLLVLPTLYAATASASHNVNTNSTSWTKASIDYVIGEAAEIGFPITHVAMNPGRVIDMASWTNGSTSALPVFFGPESARQEVYQQLWFSGYGNLRYFLSKEILMSDIWLGIDPPDVGYIQDHGSVKSVSDMKVEDRGDLHLFWEDVASYVGNEYGLWRIVVG